MKLNTTRIRDQGSEIKDQGSGITHQGSAGGKLNTELGLGGFRPFPAGSAGANFSAGAAYCNAVHMHIHANHKHTRQELE